MLYTLVIRALATALSRGLAINRDGMQRTLHLQSWQLRQLVPRSGLTDSSFVAMPRAGAPGRTQ